MTTERLFLEPKYTFHGEEGLTAAIEDNEYFNQKIIGLVCISVAQEIAFDSYNDIAECTLHLEWEQVKELRDWLTDVLEKREIL